MATLKNDLSLHNLTFEDALELALDKSLWRLLVASKRSYALTWCMPNIMMMMMTKAATSTLEQLQYTNLLYVYANSQSYPHSLCVVIRVATVV